MTAFRSFSSVWIFLAIAWAAPVSAGSLSTGLVSVDNGDVVECSLLNLSKKSLALADLSIQVLDSQGAAASATFVATDCVADRAPGQGCGKFLTSDVGQGVYCIFDFKGGAKKMRGVMGVERSGRVLTTLPAQ